MNEQVNFIAEYISSKGFEIQKNGSLKKQGGRKTLDPKIFYKEFLHELQEFTLSQFEQTVKYLSSVKQEKLDGLNSLSDLMAACQFIYEKFRWHVTEEKTKCYYLKNRIDAEEYYFLTTDKDSQKFYNCLDDNEMYRLSQLIQQYNILHPDETTEPEKLVSHIVRDIRTNPAYRLLKEPITLSNDPNQPCFKFFDIAHIESKGDQYFNKHGERPPTPAWDSFFNRIRKPCMVPVVKAYLAGLFVSENTTKQALYIFGNGNDGKSQITDCLAVKMGENVTFMLPQNMKANQFTMMDAYGKRMFLGEELQSPNVIKHGMLHAILGGSRVRLEPKNEPAFKGKVYACGVITSNYAAQIDDVENQRSRLLYIEMFPTSAEEINAHGKEWARNLKKEFSAMIYEGYKYYKEYNPSGSSFKMPSDYREIIEDLFDEKARHINDFIEDCFEEDANGFVPAKLGEAFIQYVKSQYLDKNELSIHPEYRSNQIVKEIFEKLLAKFPKISKHRKIINNKRILGISGLSITKTISHIHNFFLKSTL